MPAIWNSYSKSETARRPRMITERFDRDGEMHQQRVEGPHLDPAARRLVGDMRDLVAHDLDALVGGEERPLAGVARDADDQLIDDLDRAQDDVGVAVGDRVEGAGIDADARLAHASASFGSAVDSPLLARFGEARDRDDALAVVDLEYVDAAACAGGDADTVDRHADHLPPSVTSMIWSLSATGKTATVAPCRASSSIFSRPCPPRPVIG